MTAPAPTFEQVDPWLYELSSTGEAAAPEFWAGYRPSREGAFGTTASLDQAWEDRGAYVFLGKPPSNVATFSKQLGDLVKRLSPQLRMIWIADPTAAVSHWQFVTLEATATGSGPAIAWTVTQPSPLAVGEYGVEVPPGVPLTQADPAVLGWGIAVGALAFEGPRGTWQSLAGSAWMPLSGATLGCWRAQLTLPAAAGDGFARLGTMIRYASPRRDGRNGDAIEKLEMPVIAQGSEDVTLHMTFDWLYPLANKRTWLGFFAEDGNGPALAPLASTWRTSRGYETTLSPQPGDGILSGARLVLCQTPATVDAEPRTSTLSYHLAPAGAFQLAVVPPADPGTDTRQRLMLGLSGLEYAALEGSAGAMIHFAAPMPAFAPGAAPAAKASKPEGELLTERATTAQLTLLAPTREATPLKYYAQPRQAPLYSSPGMPGASYLTYLELPAARLPAWPTAQAEWLPTLPAAPLAGASPLDGALARRIELTTLAPARRRALGLLGADLGTDVADGTMAVTPQGLLVEAGSEEIERVVVAAMPETEEKQLDLTRIGPKLRAAIQANQMFFAVDDPDALTSDSSVRYRLDEIGLIVAEANGVPEQTIAELRPLVTFPDGRPKEFSDESEFDATVGTVAGRHLALLHEIAGFLRAVMSDWTFQLSPRSWRKGPEGPTIMLFKFCNRALTDLIEDGAAWGWSDAKADATQKELRRIAADARKRHEDPNLPPNDPYAGFYRDVLADRNWNGVLFLNAPVSLSELPQELQFLAAGIAADRFYAHHVGFSATPVEVEGGAIAIHQTAAFGLIDYQDPTDLVLSPSDPNPALGFKTLTLTARFENAALADFHARVELMVNELFGAPLTKLDPTHGNNIILAGSSQRQGGKLSYAFVLEEEHRYATDRTALDSLQVDTMQVLTANGTKGAGKVVTTFALGGFLRFADSARFDPFSYGPTVGAADSVVDGRLRFDQLAIEMTFRLGTAEAKEFGVSFDGIRLDPRRSGARSRSLIGNFPVTLASLVASSQDPRDLGFNPISVPLDQSPLASPWYGLTYTLDLGTLGALAGSTGLSLTLLAAWGPAAEAGARPLYVGLRLPGGMQWALQSVMKLSFRSFEFTTVEEGQALAYMLRLRRFALSLLGITLPPGNLDIILFGDPRHPENRTVGWYAAYDGGSADKRLAQGGRSNG